MCGREGDRNTRLSILQVMSSPGPTSPTQGDSPPHVSRSYSGTLDRSRSRSYVIKDISLDEGDALKRITQEVGGCTNACPVHVYRVEICEPINLFYCYISSVAGLTLINNAGLCTTLIHVPSGGHKGS